MSLYGPQLPPGFKTSEEDSQDTLPVIGPTLPSGFRIGSRNTQVTENPADTRPACLIGPALPPGLSSTKSLIGPALPDGIGAEGRSEDELTDEDLIGPRPSEAVTDDYVEDISSEVDKRSRKMKRHLEGTDSEDAEPKRESWMTELPDRLGSRIGLGPRTFRKESLDPNMDRSGWTDTPTEKAKKVKEETVTKEQSRRDQKEKEREENLSQELEKYNKKRRPMSLVEMHRRKEKEKKDNKKTERKEFNRDEDLKICRVDPKAAKALINNATFLTSKFSAGTSKFL